jgi:hypothetical protein
VKLEPEGRKRLDSMKKTLAAGLPLAGLLAAAATVGAAAQGCSSGAVMGKMPAPPTEEERALDGDVIEVPVEQLLSESRVTVVTAGLMAMPEEPEAPDIPEIPEGGADAPAEETAP